MYTVSYSPSAEREAERLKQRAPRQDFERLRAAMTSLAENPRPLGVIKLHGSENGYRIRVGDYRVTYEIFDREKLVVVSHVLRRNEGTYRT